VSGRQTERGLFEAALESARIFNSVAVECGVTSGLVASMRELATADDLRRRWNFHSSKSEAFRALLNVMVDAGFAERVPCPEGPAYRALPGALAVRRDLDGEIGRYQPRSAILEPWFGDPHVNLIHASNRALLGHDLHFFRSPAVRIRFDREYLDAWRTNLTNPLYEFGRLLAVQELVNRGRRFLDLAGGLGYSSQRIAQLSPEGCEIVLVDKSADFLSEARLALYPGAKIRFVLHDLNGGLPRLPECCFDGVLFNGSFHFIFDKPARLREIHQVLRPGGLLVLGHCYCRCGFADEPMHDLYFSLLEDQAWPVTFDQLRTLVADSGFHEIRSYFRGSHAYLLAERLAAADEPAQGTWKP
jgi:SAM-dependent methyltransferase